MQIAYIGKNCSTEIYRILCRYTSEKSLQMYFTFPAFVDSVNEGNELDAAIINESMITDQMFKEIEKMLNDKPNMHLIFITEFAEFQKNISMHPITFISKLAVSQHLGKVMKDLLDEHKQIDSDVLVIRFNKILYTLHKKDVLYLERISRNTYIHGKDRLLKSTASIDEIMQQLPEYFARCHKSYLVNMYEIAKISRSEVVMKNGTIIPISRNKYLHFIEKYERFLKTHFIKTEIPRRYQPKSHKKNE